MKNHLKMKQLVQETSVINDFSYPFLRLLTDRLKKLQEEDQLFDERVDLTDEVITIIHHIDGKLPSGKDAPTKYAGTEVAVLGFIERADTFLKIFELTGEEQFEAARGCEQ